MPPTDVTSVLTELAGRGGDLDSLKLLANSSSGSGSGSLHSALKTLGYTKLGDRARVSCALKGASADAFAAAIRGRSLLPASRRSSHDDTCVDDGGTLVMHGAVQDILGDGGLLKTVLRTGHNAGCPTHLSKAKVRYAAAVLPECRRFEAAVRSRANAVHA